MIAKAKSRSKRTAVVAAPGDLCDRLGFVLAQVAELQAQAKALKAGLVASGLTEVEGDLFRATVVSATVATVDWKSVASHFGPSTQLLTAHTSEAERVTVRVVSR